MNTRTSLGRLLAAGCFIVSMATAAEPKAAPPIPAPASIDELRSRIDGIIAQPRYAPALWGVKVMSLDSGQTLFEHHADRRMSPASNAKLYTGALVLDRFGTEYRIATPLFATVRPDENGRIAGDVIVSGRGDPSWNSRHGTKNFWDVFEPFVAVLTKAGVKEVKGDIIADGTYFREQPNGAGWTADDLNDYYGAEISAIALEDNYAELHVKPAATVGAPCELEWVAAETGLTVDNRTTTAAAGTPKRLEPRRLYGETVVHLFGQLPLGSPAESVDITVPRPATWFAAAFKAALMRKGIRVGGVARGLRWPDSPAATANAYQLGEIMSPPLGELVRAMMKPSQNLEADMFFALVGETLRKPEMPPWRTSEDLGAAALEQFLREHGLPAGDVQFEEGSGLSRNNLTTARATVALLTFMAKHRAAEDFRAALPVAGVDGTLRRRMKGTAAEGRVHAKTGSLRYAKSLSGYVTSAAGERLVFSLMLNRDLGAAEDSRNELDTIAIMLTTLSERSDGRAPAAKATAVGAGH